MGLMGCQETSTQMYIYRLHNNPLRGGSLKPREDSSVGTLTRLRARRPRNRGSITDSGKELLSYV